MNSSAPTPTRLAAATVAVALLVGCADPPLEETPSLQVAEDLVRAPDGSTLLHIDDLGGSIQVNDDATFGAANHFLDASLSPGGERVAVVTSGAAHGAGWVLERNERVPHPAAFQYGGSVSLGPWSQDGEWIAFIHEGPAGDRTLTAAHGRRPAATVEEASHQVRAPGHDDMASEERIYHVLEWREGRLLFRLAERVWSFDPRTREVREEEG